MPEPVVASAEPAALPPATQRRKASVTQLPWGVIGVGAVIVALALGAVLFLRNTGGAVAPSSTATLVGVVTGTQQVAAVSPTAGVTLSPTVPATPADTAVPPTSTPPPVTDTPVPPAEYEVQAGDTCGGIATKYGIELSAFTAYNSLDADNCLIRIGDKVLIPPPTATPGPSPTLPADVTAQPGTPGEPMATQPPQIVYQVKGGDTCGEIAQKFRIPVDTLVQQNSLDSDCTLQIGQTLTLTFATPTPGVSPTPIIAQTPTPRTGYEQPQVTSPRDGAEISDTQEVVTLQWLSAGLLKDDEWYVVQVQPSGAITVPVFETKATSIKLTRAIFADQIERSFAWWVQIKQLVGANSQTGERIYNPVSPPSIVRRFTWRRPVVTPVPSPNP